MKARILPIIVIALLIAALVLVPVASVSASPSNYSYAEQHFPKKGHMKLLAVSDTCNGYKGITADLYLEVQPGEGKVFIESFPLTKMDTQISTRFAKEIACNELQLDCDKYNFFYTIKADTALVGGPSAGAAAAVLTAAVIEGYAPDESVAMTGTINSGGLVGPVGGLKEKISAASKMGIKKILIPEGERYVKQEVSLNLSITLNTSTNISNETTDLVEFGKKAGIKVIEVSDMREALHQFTGKGFDESPADFAIEESYLGTMKSLANQLCDKSSASDASEASTTSTGNASGLEDIRAAAKNLTDKGLDALGKGQFYSSASYCFGANVRYSYLDFESHNYSMEQAVAVAEGVKRDSAELEKKLPKYTTITDLQSYAVVKERLLDAADNINLSLKYLDTNRTADALFALAYAKERVFSAQAWSKFFGNPGKKFALDKEALEASCRTKISEAEERYEYAKLFMDGSLSSTRRDIDRAYDDLENKDYELCLSKASKAKAESDVLLSSLGVEEKDVSGLVEKKLEVARRTIARQAKNGVFPIVGYSYYEYANSLKESDKYSALLYTEYALEMSNLDIYFKKAANGDELQKQNRISSLSGSSISGVYGKYAVFAAGALSGAAIALIAAALVLRIKRKRAQVISSKSRVVKRASVRRRV